MLIKSGGNSNQRMPLAVYDRTLHWQYSKWGQSFLSVPDTCEGRQHKNMCKKNGSRIQNIGHKTKKTKNFVTVI